MDTMALFADTAWLPKRPGVPFGGDEGRIVTNALVAKSMVLLANYGLLTVGSTIEEATVLGVVFERAARL